MRFEEPKTTPPGGLEPPTFRLTAERASQLRHGGCYYYVFKTVFKFFNFASIQTILFNGKMDVTYY
jgi:hypothetical protein